MQQYYCIARHGIHCCFAWHRRSLLGEELCVVGADEDGMPPGLNLIGALRGFFFFFLFLLSPPVLHEESFFSRIQFRGIKSKLRYD